MRSAAAPTAPVDAPPRSFAPSGGAWFMLAFGLACGLAVGQFTAGRAVRADLYALKKDVAEVRRAADSLTAAGGRSDQVASLLEDLRKQRAAVKEADGAWREANAALAQAARLRENSETALLGAKETALHAQTVAAAAADALEGSRAARDAATEAGAVLTAVAATGPQSAAAREAVAAHAALMTEQAETFAAARAAWDAARESARGLVEEAEAVDAAANAAAADLNAAKTALADLAALKTLVREAGADFPAVWQTLDGLLTMRDWLAENPVPRIAVAPDAAPATN
ncbi:hypothetical protein [Alienimonas sp. DA493]|uniref:hypothetical protein n=1 Tax=Alienimonas sp. DA493 TaxID=3373605 RepID=UPI003754E82A